MESTPIRIDKATVKEIRDLATESGRTATGQLRIIYKEWKADQKQARQRPDGNDLV